MDKECWLEQGIALFSVRRAHCRVLSVLIQKDLKVSSCALNVFGRYCPCKAPSLIDLVVAACLFPFHFNCFSSLPFFYDTTQDFEIVFIFVFVLYVWMFCLKAAPWVYRATETRRGLPILWV